MVGKMLALFFTISLYLSIMYLKERIAKFVSGRKLELSSDKNEIQNRKKLKIQIKSTNTHILYKTKKLLIKIK